MRVHPSASESQQDTEPLARSQDLALAVPPNAQNKHSLEMADDVECQCACSPDDQELRQVVHGCHDTRCACAPENAGGDLAEIRDGIKEGNKGDEKADGDGSLVQEELWWGDSKVFNLLADPDLVQGRRTKCQCRDDDAEELGLGCNVHCERNADACCQNGREHVSCDLLAEHDEVDEDDGRGGHDLGQLVKANRIEGQGKIAEDDVAGKEATDWQHVPKVEAHSLECAEGTEGGDEEDECGCSEMPHDDHELACFQLRVAEHTALL